MAEPRWTAEQRHAIFARGGTLLVSAGAGSGKTAVLTQRVMERLFDPEEPVDADRMLIVTYTRAAAQEMRQRIARKIEQRQQQFPEDTACRRQRMLLDRAQISTVHAFCQELLRQNFQRLDIPPDFRVADEKELDVWEQEVMAQTVEEFYREAAPAFLDLVELLSAGRDDRALLDTARRLYHFARSHPFYDDWLAGKLAAYGAGGVAASPWGAFLVEEALGELRYVKVLAGRMRERTEGVLSESFATAFASYEQAAGHLLERLQAGEWDGVRQALRTLSLPTFRRSKKIEEQALMEEAAAVKEELSDRLDDLRDGVFVSSEAQFLEDLQDLQPKVEQLFALVRRFDSAFARRKRENRAVDFSDLEHFSLALLMERTVGADGVPRYAPSAYARQVAAGFDQVFVDEYQDTNEVQDMLFRAVSREERNLFLVGDVKQSIYRFRQAMPEIFLEKKAEYAPFDGEHFPAKLDLARNFRSRREVTDGVNFLFERLMTRTVGEIDYAAGEQLVPGAEFPPPRPQDGPCVSLELLDMSQTEGEEKAAEAEADYVAGRIAELLRSGLTVQGEEGERPLRPGDIAILLRAPKEKAPLYREALESRGVGALAEAQRSYLGSREVTAVLSLLRVVDDPLLDVPLAAAMLSPLFSFTPDELASLRLGAKADGGTSRSRGSLWSAVLAAAKRGEACPAALVETVDALRMEAASLPLSQVLIRLCNRTGAEARFQTLEAGETRRQNLRLLIQHAADYEARGYRGLGGFLRFLDRVEEQGGDLGGATVLSDSGESVSILSVHKSKGLEFPVVFLCDTAKRFNTRDLSEKVLLHSALGLATVRRDPVHYRQFTTIPLEAVRRCLRRASQSEEMRVLYVALTRAKERLYLTAAAPNLEKRIDRCCGGGGAVSPQRVAGCSSYLDWIMLALLADVTPGSHQLEPGRVLTLSGVPVAVRMAGWERREEKEERTGSVARPDPVLLEAFRRRGAFRYPHEGATLIPTKLAISELAHAQGEDFRFRQRPRFLHQAGLTPAERGNALHRFMQFCDYRAAALDPAAEIARLVDGGFLSPAEGAAIPPDKLAAFFASPLAERIFASPRVWREYRFLAEAGRELLAPYTDLPLGEERTAIQGVADCIFLENGCGVVVDYKTDHVRTPEELADRYRTQLLLYRELLGASLDIPIKACIIYSFGLSREIPVESTPISKTPH